jgi:cytochrome c553
MNKSFVILAAAGLMFCAQAAFADGDAATGKDKAQACAACHGADGLSTSDQFPILAGQYKDYIIQALHEYKNGGRNNPIMKGMAADLSEDDIRNLAEYFASLPGPLHTIPQGGEH